MSKPIDNKTPLSVTQAAVTVALAAYLLGLGAFARELFRRMR